MSGMVWGLFCSLGMTLAAEFMVAWAWKVKIREFPVVLLVNLITNPPLVFFLYAGSLFLGRFQLLCLELTAEILIFLLEGFLYKKRLREFSHCYLLSFTANGCSFGLGVLWNFVT